MQALLSLLANPFIASLIIIIGFILLIKGADWLVDGAGSVARRMGVSSLVIGLTVVAFGTSMPEFIVSTIAAIQHNTEIAITNILGSNAINTFIILGITAIIFPISSQRSCRRFDVPWSLLAGLLVLFFATYTRPTPIAWGNFGAFSFELGFISGIGGTVLLIGFAVFMIHSIYLAKKHTDEDDSSAPTCTLAHAIILIISGLAALVLGGEMIVRSATSIAHMLGVGDAIIGLTVVALGTSLPELATSCMAAYKHNADLALGNVIGSNIFNVFFILGVSACIQPLPTYDGLLLDAAMVALSSLMVLVLVHTNRRHEISRLGGALLLLVYVVYLGYRLYMI